MRPRERSKITTIPMMNQPSGIGQKEDSESSKLSSSMSDKRFSKSCVSNLFTSIPPIAALKKKAVVWKRSSAIGALWDVSQVFFSILACGLYIAETYQSSYGGDLILRWIEIVITQFFSLDFLFNWFVATTTKLYFLSPMTYVDIITIVPVYLTLILGDRNIPNLSLLRFVRILRLIRILRTFKMLGGLSGIRRQVITLSLTLLSLTFMAAGIVQVMENDVKQLSYDCRFINEDTRYQPSCTSSYPSYDDDNCDCNKNNCFPAYADGDYQGEPSLIRCLVLPYFDCFYFIVVTMATVGYGDISPSTAPSKAVIIMFIVTSLIVIPMQINKLNLLISMSSTFRNTYAPQSHETHVIVCGHVNDSSKLERLFKEFFHPDRYVHSAPEYHLVILSPLEPTEEVRSLLVSPLFDSRVTYIIGSALSMDDLQRVRADIAAAMFFVCNIEVQSQEAFFDDASTVLRTLSVSNFNSNLECFVQVLRPEDRDILKDSDVDVIICLDEFKTSIQARNAICPGLSTLIENLFHSFGQQIEPTKENDSYWLDEYIYGARMELYYVPLPELLLEALNYDWNLLVEGIYNQFGRMLIGVCNTDSHSVIFNPGLTEFQKFHSAEKFFEVFQIGIVICSDQSEASEIAVGIADHSSVEKITLKLTEMEASFAVRRLPEDDGGGGSGSDSYGGNGSHSLGSLSLTSQRRKYEKSYRDIITYSKLVPKQLLSHETDEGKQLPQQQQQEGGGLGKGGRKTGHGNSSGSTLPGNNSRVRRGAAAPQKTTSRTESLTLPTLKVDIPEGFGKPSMKLSDASNIMDHVIVFGCVDYIHIFVNELRRPLISGDAYRPIVIVSEFEPHRWNTIKSKYTDVYYVQEVLTTSQGFNASNVRDANAVILLASRDSVTMVEEENLDAETLFAYLKLERYIPRFVYFTVELTCANNMSVLNSTIMRSKRQVKVTTQNLHTRQFNDMTNENTEGKAGGGGGGGGGMFQKPGARMEHTQLRGSFTSQRKVITVGEMNQTKSSKNLLRTNPGRRLSSMKIRSLEKSDLGQEVRQFHSSHFTSLLFCF
jgi:voltage-gated potassium channel Kch